jgi:Rrf2 family nitric oxide-sensitive transcriptional repressor
MEMVATTAIYGKRAAPHLMQINGGPAKTHNVCTLGMRLTAFTDYCLRVLIYLARAPEGRATIARIALAFDISEHHLAKVVNFLGAEGLLLNTRGHGGGLRLARTPSAINVAEVVRLAEGDALPVECFDRPSNTCPLAGGCGLERVLREAVKSFYASLERYSIADLQMQPRALRILFERAPSP